MQSSLPIGGMAVKILFWKWKNRLLFNSRRSQTLSPCADVPGLSTAKENLQADMLLTQQGELRLPFFRRKFISLDHIKILLSESLLFFLLTRIFHVDKTLSCIVELPPGMLVLLSLTQRCIIVDDVKKPQMACVCVS